MRLLAIKSYTASRKPAGINRNVAASENGNPSRLNIRRTAEERISTRSASTTMIEPIPPSGRPACRENAVPDSDCLAVNRKTSLRSKWSKKLTQRLQNAHSPSKTTTACCVECTSLLSQAESLHRSSAARYRALTVASQRPRTVAGRNRGPAHRMWPASQSECA